MSINMRKIWSIINSFSLLIIIIINVVACTTPNDLEKSFNYDNNVILDNQEFTLDKLGLKSRNIDDIYDFYFNKLDINTTFKIVKIKPNQLVNQFYFEKKYPYESPNKYSEIAVLSGNDYAGTKGLIKSKKIVVIPLTLSLMDSSIDNKSKTGFSYQFTSLIMNIKINVIFNK